MEPERVNSPAPVLFNEPAPVIAPEEVPAPTERVLAEAIEIVPPLRVETVASPLAVKEPPDIVVIVAVPPEVNEPAESVATVDAPLMFAEPPEIFAAVVCPRVPAVTVPAEMALFNAPVTATVPLEIPLVIVALLPKMVEPAPDKVVTVTVPVLPLKFTVPALERVPTL